MVRYVLAVLLLSACGQRPDGSDFTLPNRPVNEKILRLDGYYIFEQPNNVEHTPVFFLFENGAVLTAGAIKTDSIEKVLDDGIVLAKARNLKMAWGHFLIDEKSITMERRQYAGGSLMIVIQSGLIANDSTFVITKTSTPIDGKSWESHQVFRFKKYSPKPDSVSEFLQ